MIEFGITLRNAREAKGLTVEQVAEKTHLMSQIIRDLENENFSKIAAPIYGRGFVKLYCDAVGLEAKPMIAEFMDIFTGRREPTIRVREFKTETSAPAVEETPAVPAAETVEPAMSATVSEGSLFEENRRDEGISVPETEPSVGTETQIAAIPPRKPAPSRYAAPIPIDEREESAALPSPILLWIKTFNWRAAVVITAILLVLWFLFSSVRWLYHATMDEPSDGAASESVATQTATSVHEERKVNSTGEKAARNPERIPPLYID